jgi:hypothetical protein
MAPGMGVHRHDSASCQRDLGIGHCRIGKQGQFPRGKQHPAGAIRSWPISSCRLRRTTASVRRSAVTIVNPEAA